MTGLLTSPSSQMRSYLDKYICQAFTPAIINIGLYCEVVGFEAFVTKQTARIIFHTTATGENGVEKLKSTY